LAVDEASDERLAIGLVLIYFAVGAPQLSEVVEHEINIGIEAWNDGWAKRIKLLTPDCTLQGIDLSHPLLTKV